MKTVYLILAILLCIAVVIFGIYIWRLQHPVPYSAEQKLEFLQGRLQKVDTAKHEVVVDGIVVKITKNTTLIGENEMGIQLRVTLHDAAPYIGRTAKCSGFRTGPKELTALKIKIYEKR